MTNKGSFTSGIILKSYHETKRNFKKVQSDSVRRGRDTSRVAIAEDGIAVSQIAVPLPEAIFECHTWWRLT